jgi:protein required for attachment to host cells
MGELSREIFNRVMAEVEGRLAADLEKRLVQHLVPQVHSAVASALGDLHQELANAIGDAVTAALKDRQLKS